MTSASPTRSTSRRRSPLTRARCRSPREAASGSRIAAGSSFPSGSLPTGLDCGRRRRRRIVCPTPCQCCVPVAPVGAVFAPAQPVFGAVAPVFGAVAPNPCCPTGGFGASFGVSPSPCGGFGASFDGGFGVSPNPCGGFGTGFGVSPRPCNRRVGDAFGSTFDFGIGSTSFDEVLGLDSSFF
nr:hypothetical protein [Pandoravirus belohorizontensis]